MPMLKDPSSKYRRFKPLNLKNRQWPSKTIEKPPRWLETGLRDGNQSLVDPMDGEQKLVYFKEVVELGYKEVEVSFPSASQTDFDFTRSLVETPGLVPDDVWLQVLSPCRPELIQRTVESLRGAKKAILHLYLATSECFQRMVFGTTPEENIELAVKCTKIARSLTKDDPSQAGTHWHYEFSPEFFSDTDPEYAVKMCNAVREAWEPTEKDPIIFNLPATVEMATPNVYADQIEYFCTHIGERNKICVSLHPHNDRGCAVAAAELAQMAGADRVEGVLFGNGERTGNVDLVTLALNLYTQGIWPNIDFSDINSVIHLVETSCNMPVHQRTPYGGELVVTAFSGSHQDAIKKGFQQREKNSAGDPSYHWEIPYIPLDPQDIGRNYEAVIRVNSQSGKGGAAWVIQRHLNLDLPRGLQIAFSRVVQKEADRLSRELQPQELVTLFKKAYNLSISPRLLLRDYNILADRSKSPAPAQPGRSLDTRNLRRTFQGFVELDGEEHEVRGVGNGPLSSLSNALLSLGIDVDVANYYEHSIGGSDGERGRIGKGSEVKAATYIEATSSTSQERVWGIGIHQDAAQASLFALLSAASSFIPSTPGKALPLRPKQEGLSDNITVIVNGNETTKPSQ